MVQFAEGFSQVWGLPEGVAAEGFAVAFESAGVAWAAEVFCVGFEF